jgi:predicted transcriptional regulator
MRRTTLAKHLATFGQTADFKNHANAIHLVADTLLDRCSRPEDYEAAITHLLHAAHDLRVRALGLQDLSKEKI